MTLMSSPPSSAPSSSWTAVCALRDILPGLGVCALVNGEQVAVFHVAGRVYAVGNRDPRTGANVISRGLTGSYTKGGETRVKVASPLLKNAFDLATGESLDDPATALPTYPVRVEGGDVWIGSAV
ncbi:MULTISPECIES: nitrite reductase small subunit NirD [Deinococcus]|uniref:Nitrite reductase small subunit NirD n=1 Tax=Deinococcus rufus TaxID=2136097 RepID=A0ABV7Z4U5_9DEIO|nr:nitrite reductase small subunit NirD [Deinococcus sp. AB2017081]WQE96376.1 nitrite reductase small subunit NirD [Deinococcus sp. AB2017081]